MNNLKIRSLFLFSVLSLMLLVLGCQINPATGKKDLILISTAQEISMGLNIHNDLLAQMKPSKNAKFSHRVEKIGSKISRVCDRTDLEFSFYVVAQDDLNAFAAPGGFVYATQGLVDASTEDELAGVIGHECGHIAARHSVKNIQMQMAGSLILLLIDKNSDKDEVKAASAVAFNLLMLGYSRKYEYQADLLGARYAWRAGYNPHGMSSFFRKLKAGEQTSGSFPEFLSTHPDLDKRIHQLENVIKAEMLNPDGSLKTPPPLPALKTNPADVSNPS